MCSCRCCRGCTRAGSGCCRIGRSASCASGSWIGGDRDGNPNVTAATLGVALQRASRTLLDSYLQQLHALSAELSISTELSTATDEVLALAEASGNGRPGKRDEPYRRALAGDHATT